MIRCTARNLLLLGICFWRKGRGNSGWAKYMGEKGGCQETRTGRCADGAHIKTLENDALLCKPVNIGRFYIGISMVSEIAVTLVIGQ